MSRGMLYASYPRSIRRDSITAYSDPKLQTLKEPSFGVRSSGVSAWDVGFKA